MTAEVQTARTPSQMPNTNPAPSDSSDPGINKTEMKLLVSVC